jgi:prepilin-type N-terminal cleavage/methylation domain-containing protein
MNRKRSFTLIELLVVIAIIAILVAMLLPALSLAKEQGKRANCIANLKQHGYLLISYADEHDSEMPGGNATLHPGWGIDSSYALSGGGKPMGLAFLITEDYISQDGARIFYCPSWDHPWNQYDMVDTAGADGWFGANKMGGWPAPGNNGPTAHRGFAYMYRSTFGTGSNEPPDTLMDDPASRAINADMWCHRELVYGFHYGHVDAYGTLYLDGHAKMLQDRSYYLVSAQPARNNGSWALQEGIWQAFFDGK